MRPVLLVVLVILVALFIAPSLVDRFANRLEQPRPPPAPAWAKELMRGSVDLHADPLLWGRNLLKRGSRGHVDLPRLQAGGAGLQVFSVRSILTCQLLENVRYAQDTIAAAYDGVSGVVQNQETLRIQQ